MGSEVMDRALAPSSFPEAGPGPSGDADGAPESWEMVDLEASMKKLLAPSSGLKTLNRQPLVDRDLAGSRQQVISSQIQTVTSASNSSEVFACKSVAIRPDDIDEVDSFLREALQGKDRLTILRLEKDVEKFMRNPRLQQFEFQPMPSSYLRLAAHRVVQHYNLQSLVADTSNPDSTRIIARKTPESRFPKVRLADISFNNFSDDQQVQTSSQKFELKRRPNRSSKYSRDGNGSSDPSSKLNPVKSVEERKEEYNRARARIFNNSEYGGRGDDETSGIDTCSDVDSFSNGTLRHEKKIDQPSEIAIRAEYHNSLPRVNNVKLERELANSKGNNRVAIFRDREKDKKDPDYDRSYDRYMQRFDPGFGVNQPPFGVQAVYTPVVNYNTEFPQLGGAIRPQMCVDPPLHRPVPHVRGPWTSTSNGLGFGHGHPDPVMNSFSSGHIGTHSASGVYMHPQQYARPAPTMTYVHSQERFPQSVSQSHLPSEGSFSQARRQ